MHRTSTRFEQVPLKVVRKIIAESAKAHSPDEPVAKKVLFVKHPVALVRGEKL
jgi:hypothetical protein